MKIQTCIEVYLGLWRNKSVWKKNIFGTGIKGKKRVGWVSWSSQRGQASWETPSFCSHTHGQWLRGREWWGGGFFEGMQLNSLNQSLSGAKHAIAVKGSNTGKDATGGKKRLSAGCQGEWCWDTRTCCSQNFAIHWD